MSRFKHKGVNYKVTYVPYKRDMVKCDVICRLCTIEFKISKSFAHGLYCLPQEVCTQIWATLYDYPCLKSTDGIVRYVKECVRVAWGLVNQVRDVFLPVKSIFGEDEKILQNNWLLRKICLL